MSSRSWLSIINCLSFRSWLRCCFSSRSRLNFWSRLNRSLSFWCSYRSWLCFCSSRSSSWSLRCNWLNRRSSRLSCRSSYRLLNSSRLNFSCSWLLSSWSLRCNWLSHRSSRLSYRSSSSRNCHRYRNSNWSSCTRLCRLSSRSWLCYRLCRSRLSCWLSCSRLSCWLSRSCCIISII